MRYLNGWRPLLRLAFRDAVRARGRSLIVLVMIALPVLGVTAGDILIQTATVSGTEALSRRLGHADARVEFQGSPAEQVEQAADPNRGMVIGEKKVTALPTRATIERALGRHVPATSLTYYSEIALALGTSVVRAQGTAIDLRDPLATGLFRLTSGRAPRSADEIVVSSAVVRRGARIGSTVALATGATRTVVGVVESTTQRNDAIVVGPPGSLAPGPLGQMTSFLIGGGPVTWSDVRKLNHVGAQVLSAYVLRHPPSAGEIPTDVTSSSDNGAVVQVTLLVVVMALLEVALLAGPAFAVGARRQARTIALVAAAGGTRGQLRRVVLGSAVVLGGCAAVVGAVLGIGVARLAEPIVQGYSDSWFGPFDVPWWQLLGFVAFGLASALLAAVVPAWLASRQDVVRVLSGRRGEQATRLRFPALGVVLMAVGIAGVVFAGHIGRGTPENVIAASSVVVVLGMILLIPVILAGLGRVARGLPLPMRYAVRDAARHRSRTVPAVAAVAATVMGVVALGISASSDEAQSRGEYQLGTPLGTGMITDDTATAADWSSYAAKARAIIPGISVTPIQGLGYLPDPTHPDVSRDISFSRSPKDQWDALLNNSTGSLGASVLVGDAVLPSAFPWLSSAEQARADGVLAQGGAVVFSGRPVAATTTYATVSVSSGNGEPHHRAAVRLPATYLAVRPHVGPPAAILSSAAAGRLAVAPTEVGLFLHGATITGAQRHQLNVAIASPRLSASLTVERGYTSYQNPNIALLVLAGLAAVLMLGGTLTATFLALSDARPDLATLAAVGAAPRTRRGVAAAYALVVGVVGAVLGAAVGFVPGVAAAHSLTRGFNPYVSHTYVDVPWLLVLGVVIGLPLLTAAIVGTAARSRLPLVTRID